MRTTHRALSDLLAVALFLGAIPFLVIGVTLAGFRSAWISLTGGPPNR